MMPQLRSPAKFACRYRPRQRILTVPLVSVLEVNKSRIQEGMKRTIQVNVKMNPEDFNLLKKAAEQRWPDAVMTNSGIVLGLAKIAAKATLAKRKR